MMNVVREENRLYPVGKISSGVSDMIYVHPSIINHIADGICSMMKEIKEEEVYKLYVCLDKFCNFTELDGSYCHRHVEIIKKDGELLEALKERGYKIDFINDTVPNMPVCITVF